MDHIHKYINAIQKHDWFTNINVMSWRIAMILTNLVFETLKCIFQGAFSVKRVKPQLVHKYFARGWTE